MKKIAACAAAAALGWASAVSYAKLPAPTEEQKVKAAETKAKAEESAKKDADALARSQDRAADNFKRTRASVRPEAKR